MKMMIAIAVCITTLSACAPSRPGDPSVEYGLNSSANGFGNLVLSALQIAAGLLEGVAALPVLVLVELHAINQSLNQSQAAITLDDTYQYSYDTPFAEVPSSGGTGVVFRRMRNATAHFQKLLRGHGVQNPERYLLTSIKTANKRGYTLYAVIERESIEVNVTDKYDQVSGRTFRHGDRLYYEPYRTDARGRRLDTIIDWAAVPRTTIGTQKGQAILMTLAANSVLNDKHSDDYWDIEARWIAGDRAGPGKLDNRISGIAA